MTNDLSLRNSRRSRRGLATVEMAIVLPLLVLMLFGIMEMGLLFKDFLMLQQGVREAARTAALGAIPSEIVATVSSAAVSLDPSQLTVTVQYRTWNGTGWDYTWDTAPTLGEGGTSNNAPPGAQILVKAKYNHKLVTGSLFSFMATNSAKTMVGISASSVVRRE